MIDDEKSRRFYQIVKYVKANKDKSGDNIVKDFTERQGFGAIEESNNSFAGKVVENLRACK